MQLDEVVDRADWERREWDIYPISDGMIVKLGGKGGVRRAAQEFFRSTFDRVRRDAWGNCFMRSDTSLFFCFMLPRK